MQVGVEVTVSRGLNLLAVGCLGIVSIQAALAKAASDKLGEAALPEVTALYHTCNILVAACLAWVVADVGKSIFWAGLRLAGLFARHKLRIGLRTDFVEVDKWTVGECWACFSSRPLVQCMPCGHRSCCHTCVTGWLGSNPTFRCLTCRKVPDLLGLPALPQPDGP